MSWQVPIPAELNRERQIDLGEHTIWAMLGPLDVPREVLVTREHKHVQLEFHYSAPIREQRKTTKSGALRITVGRKTGRVLSIEKGDGIDSDELARALELLHTGVGAEEVAQQPQRRICHYRLIAEDVLPWVEQQLQHELMLEAR